METSTTCRAETHGRRSGVLGHKEITSTYQYVRRANQHFGEVLRLGLGRGGRSGERDEER